MSSDTQIAQNSLNQVSNMMTDMVMPTITNYDRLSILTKVKQREVACPVMKVKAVTTPIMAAEDLVLMTSIVSPENYYRELTQLIYKHSKFPDINTSIPYNQFTDNVSNPDRKLLLWGMYASTYNVIHDSIELQCPNSTCNHEFTDKITADQLINAEDIVIWDKDVNFKDYIFKITKILDIEDPDDPENKLYSIEFDTCLPSINQFLEIFKLISSEKLRENYERYGTMLSNPEDLTMVCKQIRVYKSADDTQPEIYDTIDKKHAMISNFIPLDLSKEILTKYKAEFDKYDPIFRKKYICPECEHKFHYSVDIEAALFQRFLG
jgi:hypothetical protein